MGAAEETSGHCRAARDGGEFAEFRRPAHRAGIELYRADLSRLAFAPHVHDAYGIGAIAAGVERFAYRGSEHLAAAGTLVFMHPDEMHTGRAETDAGWRYAMLYLDPGLLPTLLGEHDTGGGVDFTAVTEHDPARAQRFLRQIDRLWQTDDALTFDSRLVALLDDCLRPSLRRRPLALPARDSRFAVVREAIEAGLDGPLSLPELAAIAGLSPFHFLRAFRDAVGSTPHAYVQARRVARAKRLLAAGLSPAEAAAGAGFADQSHLNRWLYRTHGTTPGRYRQQFRPRPAA